MFRKLVLDGIPLATFPKAGYISAASPMYVFILKPNLTNPF